MSSRGYSTLLSVIISCVLMACGGGRNSFGGSSISGPPDAGTAEGLWEGSTSAGRSVGGLILQDGTYWFHYSSAGNNAVLGGVLRGNGTSNSGQFTSTNGVDLNFEGSGSKDVDVADTYTAKSDLSGTFTYTPTDVIKFSAIYDSSYELTPSLSTLAGNYSGSGAMTAGLAAVRFSVASGGAIAGAISVNCSFSGFAKPALRGNVYDISLSFNGSGCPNGSSSVQGIAYIATGGQFIVTALNTAWTDGLVFEASKL